MRTRGCTRPVCVRNNKRYRIAVTRGELTPHAELSDELTERLRTATKVMSYRQVSEITGFPPNYILRWLSGKHISEKCHRRLLGRMPALEQATKVTKNKAAVRKVRALYAYGHTAQDIAEATGRLTPRSISRIARGEQQSYRGTLRSIDAAYRSLSTDRGTNRRSFQYAAKRGWFSPIAWDDIDTDPRPHTGADAYYEDANITREQFRENQKKARRHQ